MKKVNDAMQELNNGHGRNNEGSLKLYFDERDNELQQLKLEPDQELTDWLQIIFENK